MAARHQLEIRLSCMNFHFKRSQPSHSGLYFSLFVFLRLSLPRKERGIRSYKVKKYVGPASGLGTVGNAAANAAHPKNPSVATAFIIAVQAEL